MHLDVPPNLLRNLPYILSPEHGLEKSGQFLIDLATRRVGLKTLANTDVLDVGCGSRFTATIVNNSIPIKSYSGIEIHKPTVDFLNENVASKDDRFSFAHWDVKNRSQNPGGKFLLSEIHRLPFDGTFDLIWLFSVFTHLDVEDASAMLRLLRKYIRPRGKLFFSAFVDESLGDNCNDQLEIDGNVYYGKSYMCKLIDGAKWSVDAYYDKDPKTYIQNHFVCSPQ